MIDLKLNEIPADPEVLTEEEREARARETPVRGLSINDTIAHNANLSMGAQGADTSGVRAGAGAGAGSTWLTPEVDPSGSPEIVPGGRGTTVVTDDPSNESLVDDTKFEK